MIDLFLQSGLGPALRRERRLRLWSWLALGWLATAGIGLAGYAACSRMGWSSRWLWPGVAGLGAVLALVIRLRQRRRQPAILPIAQKLEERHPDLDGRLLTAAEQPVRADRETAFLHQRLIDEVMDHSHAHRWQAAVPISRLCVAKLAHYLAIGLLALLVFGLKPLESREPTARLPRGQVEVAPGDTELERGTSLVVLARFGNPVPDQVDLVLAAAAPGADRRFPLTRSLSDPVYGGSVPNVQADFSYHLEFGERRTRDYHVKVFEFPRLVRADADLRYPEYTSLEARRIEDTRRISAVEGTHLDLRLQFNKPVVTARLRDPADRDAEPLVVSLTEPRTAAALSNFVLRTTQTLRLELIDTEGRTNKAPTQFVLTALTNRLPELRLTSPRGDQRPSALEEISFAGTVWDDFGVHAYGLAYTPPDGESRLVTLGGSVSGRDRRAFDHLLRLEELNVDPDALLTWYVWAEDIGPEGEVRRAFGDLFFAEVRPFEEIFRQAQNAAQQQQQSPSESGEQPGQEGSQASQLVELQKQIISATWRVRRDHAGTPSDRLPPAYAEDAAVVRDSQVQAREQAETARDENQDSRVAAFWQTAVEEMQKAADQLGAAVKSPEPLPSALTAEQAAYQALLRLQQREYEVAQQQQQSRGQQSQSRQNSRQQQMQRQLDQLDVTQSENRYETERLAESPVTPERREELQVLNRLRELARRQQDVNERLRELQTALQEARTEEAREAARRELKRLQEEEQRMLTDLDELRQRMDRAENQSRMAEQRQRLDETREDLRRAAEAAAEGQASQALAAGARAERQMEELRDELRRETSSEFAEDLRRMRGDARELARKQQRIQEDLNTLDDGRRNSLTDSSDRETLLDQLEAQRDRLTNLVERVETVSELAEASEPLVSRELYDTLRSFTQQETVNVREFRDDLLARGILSRSLYDQLRETEENDRAKSLTLASEMLRRGLMEHTGEAERRAREGIEDLKQGVENAAEKVLGDDTEALRLAQRELDALTQQLQRELDLAGNSQPGNPQDPSQNARRGQPGGENPDQRPSSETPPNAEQQLAQGGQPPQPGENQGQPTPGQGQGQNQGQAPDQGQQPQGGDRQEGGQPGDGNNPDPARAAEALQRAMQAASRNSGPNGGPGGGDRGTGPITGLDFAPWSDRLREVEEMIELPSLRTEVARARERAGELRRDFREDLKKPDWTVVRLEVLRPLVEVRDQVAEELARRAPDNELAPVDRDPVPPRYAELVERYYEELGRQRTP